MASAQEPETITGPRFEARTSAPAEANAQQNAAEAV
jgi:hypothetical protein